MHLSKCSSTSLLISLKSFIMWSVIDMQMEENKRQWRRREDKRKKTSKDQEGETYLLLFNSDQLLLEVVNEGSHSFVFSVMVHGHQRRERVNGEGDSNDLTFLESKNIFTEDQK